MLATIAVAVATWPVPTLAPAAGIDASWQAGLHLAARRGMDFGTDVVFTYGPLGFLGQPRMFFTSTGLLALAFTAAVHLSWCASLFVLARRFLRPVVAAVLAYAVALTPIEPAEIGLIVVLLWCLDAVQAERPWRGTAPALGAAAGLLVAVKFNTGVFAFGFAALAAWALPPSRLRSLLETGGAAAGAFLAGWVVTGNSLLALPAYVGRSIQIATGYTDAMAVEESGRAWEYPAAAIVVVVVAAVVIGLADRTWRGHRAVVGVLVVAATWAAFKRGFVRHDAHSLTFFLTMAAVPLAFRWRAARGLAAAGASLVCVGLLLQVSGWGIADQIDPLPRARRAADQLRTASSAGRRDALMTQARAAVLRDAAIPPGVAAAVADRTVHVDPTETSVVWALDLPWRPVPVFQAYSAYTPELDRLNAGALRGDRAPRRVLQPVARPAIDGRDPDHDSPAYALALTCRYRADVAEGGWRVLARAEDSCRSRPGPSVEVDGGEWVDVPPVAPGEFVIARIDVERTIVDRLRSTLFKPARHVWIETDSPRQRYRLVEATAVEGVMVDGQRLRVTGASEVRIRFATVQRQTPPPGL